MSPRLSPLAARFGVFIVCAVLGLAAPAHADVFTVRGVDVDATADSASQAKELAVADGQRLALERLIVRLTLPEDRALAQMGLVDAAIAQTLVAGLEVEEERFSGRRYIGRIAVAFDAQRARAYLRDRGLAFVEARTRPSVVVPIWVADGEPVLWGDNPWLEAWRSTDQSGELTPLIAPAGDIEDLAAINAQSADAANLNALAALASRYRAQKVLVTRADPASRVIGAFEVDLTAGGQVLPLGAVQATTLEDGVRAVSDIVQNRWKTQSVVRSRTVSEIQLAVLYPDLRTWRALQTAFGGASLVQLARLDALAPGGALMTVRHMGRLDQLAAELSERGVVLEDRPDLGLTARSAAAATAAGRFGGR